MQRPLPGGAEALARREWVVWLHQACAAHLALRPQDGGRRELLRQLGFGDMLAKQASALAPDANGGVAGAAAAVDALALGPDGEGAFLGCGRRARREGQGGARAAGVCWPWGPTVRAVRGGAPRQRFNVLCAYG